MRVLVNQMSALGTRTGIGHYTAQLLRCMRCAGSARCNRGFSWPLGAKASCAVPAIRSAPTVQVRSGTGTGADRSDDGCISAWLRAWCVNQARALARAWLTHELHLRGRSGAFDLYHEPNNIPQPTDLPTIVTIADLSVLLYPEWHPADRVADYEAHFHKGLAQGRHFLAISEFTRQEVIHKLGLRPDQVTRTYMGVRPGLGPMAADDVQEVLRRLKLPPSYFLYLGTIEPRKNLLTLLRAYVKLPAEVRERFPLLLAGGWGWNSADVAAFLHDEARHRGVITTGYVPEEHLGALLNGAGALVYPSFYEGFGLPPVEMMACGGAVICSTAGALVETAGGRAHLVEPLNEDGCAKPYSSRQRMTTGTPNCAAAPWRPCGISPGNACAADTLAVYRTVSGQATTISTKRVA